MSDVTREYHDWTIVKKSKEIARLRAENEALRGLVKLAAEHCEEMLSDPERNWHPIGKCPTLDALRTFLADSHLDNIIHHERSALACQPVESKGEE